MKWLESFIKSYPVIQVRYENELSDVIQEEKNKLKEKVPLNRWWEIDDIDHMELDLPKKEKDRLRRFELLSEMIDITKNKGLNSQEFKQIIDDLENVAKSLDENDKKEMEIMLIEGLINCMVSEKRYDQFYALLGSELRKMCDKNNEFWISLENEKKIKSD